MKFGFHTQINNWQHEETHTQVLDNIREQVQLCEQLGFDAVWLPEHHLNPEGLGNSPNPILFAADLACRTSRIRKFTRFSPAGPCFRWSPPLPRLPVQLV
ncbi:MAG: LLM class flavin-dependent oxidoreductase [Chloroflexi bacterium]|nr:LLM class flavin-dependent oxidoreductase [Chloroflexota bacterium]